MIQELEEASIDPLRTINQSLGSLQEVGQGAVQILLRKKLKVIRLLRVISLNNTIRLLL